MRRRNMHINKRGYLCFNNTNQPFHRWMAEKQLGRPLKAGEVVHHKDRNKLNNSPQNLQVFHSQQDHFKAHLIDAGKYGSKYSFSGK
jgi:hypothetical protein